MFILLNLYSKIIIWQIIIRVVLTIVVLDHLGIFLCLKTMGAMGIDGHTLPLVQPDLRSIPVLQIDQLYEKRPADDIKMLHLLRLKNPRCLKVFPSSIRASSPRSWMSLFSFKKASVTGSSRIWIFSVIIFFSILTSDLRP